MHRLDRLALRAPLATIALLTLLLSPLYLRGLGEPLLWQDEGTTAILARHIASSGLPTVGYGADSASQDFDGMRGWWDLNVDSPWLQDYLAVPAWWAWAEPPDSLEAAHQLTRLLRLPFAIIALLLPLATYALLRVGPVVADSERSIRVALLAALLTGTLADARAARATGQVLRAGSPPHRVVVGCLSGVAWRLHASARRVACLAFAAASSLLLAANDVVWVAMTVALGAHWGLFAHRDLSPRRAIAALAFPASVAAGWFLLVATADKYGRVEPTGVLDNALAYAVEVNAHVLPLAVLAIGAFLHRGRLAELVRAPASSRRESLDFPVLLGLTIAAVVGIHLFIDIVFLRYLVAIVPLCAAVAAMLLVPPVGQRSMAGAGWIVLLALTLTDVAGWLSDAPLRYGLSQRSARRHGHWDIPHTLWGLSAHLRDVGPGPVSGVLEVLYEEGDASHSMVATYGDQPLSVLSAVQVYGGFSGQYPAPGIAPEWIWLRASTSAEMEGKRGAAAAWIAANVDLTAYDCRLIDTSDRQWEWRPDPDVFWTLGRRKPVLLDSAATRYLACGCAACRGSRVRLVFCRRANSSTGLICSQCHETDDSGLGSPLADRQRCDLGSAGARFGSPRRCAMGADLDGGGDDRRFVRRHAGARCGRQESAARFRRGAARQHARLPELCARTGVFRLADGARSSAGRAATGGGDLAGLRLSVLPVRGQDQRSFLQGIPFVLERGRLLHVCAARFETVGRLQVEGGVEAGVEIVAEPGPLGQLQQHLAERALFAVGTDDGLADGPAPFAHAGRQAEDERESSSGNRP